MATATSSAQTTNTTDKMKRMFFVRMRSMTERIKTDIKYALPNVSPMVWESGFSDLASSTNLIILSRVVFLPMWVACILIDPDCTKVELIALLPFILSTGKDSPVREDSSIEANPEIIKPSTGIRRPPATSIISPTWISLMYFSSSLPFFSTITNEGRSLSRPRMLFSAFSLVISANILAEANMSSIKMAEAKAWLTMENMRAKEASKSIEAHSFSLKELQALKNTGRAPKIAIKSTKRGLRWWYQFNTRTKTNITDK